MVRRLLLKVPCALPAAFSVAMAQANAPNAPPQARSDYALTNVRIVTAPGRVAGAVQAPSASARTSGKSRASVPA